MEKSSLVTSIRCHQSKIAFGIFYPSSATVWALGLQPAMTASSLGLNFALSFSHEPVASPTSIVPA